MGELLLPFDKIEKVAPTTVDQTSKTSNRLQEQAGASMSLEASADAKQYHEDSFALEYARARQAGHEERCRALLGKVRSEDYQITGVPVPTWESGAREALCQIVSSGVCLNRDGAMPYRRVKILVR